VEFSEYLPHSGQRTVKRQDLGIPSEAFVLVSVGRLQPGKNYPVALEALCVLARARPERHVHYVVCGSGPEERLIQDRAERLGIAGRVHLLGRRSDVSQLLEMADCFLSTSLYEGLPLTVLEALASGIPCVLSPIREHCDIADGLPGCVFGADMTGRGIAEAVLAAMTQKHTRELLRRCRVSRLEKFSLQKCAQSYESLYRSLVWA
jgi:glycosyltransferase involved in cell wall biosynthesis